MKYDELMRFLGFSPEGTENFDVEVMQSGELFDVHEIATATRRDAKRLGLKPRGAAISGSIMRQRHYMSL